MKKSRLALFSVAILVIVSILLFFQLTSQNGSSPLLATVDYSTTYSTISTLYQRQTFFANNNYWLFYSNGNNLFCTSSSDGLNWHIPTKVTSGLSASAMSIWYENDTVHYANAGGPGSPVVYRKGQIVGNEIMWDDEQVVAQAVTTIERYNAYVTVDSSGRPWVSHMSFDSKATQNPWTVQVTRAESSTGETWAAPMQVSNPSFYPLRPSIYSLPNERMYAIYVSENGAEGRLWDGTSWQQPETITNRDFSRDPSYSAASLNDEVHVTFMENGTSNVYYYKRQANGKWEETLIEAEQAEVSVPVMTVDSAKRILYILWMQANTLQVRRMESGNWEKIGIPNLALTSPRALSAFYEVKEGKIGVAMLERISHDTEVYKLRYFVVSNL